MKEGGVTLCIIFAKGSDIQEGSEQSVDLLRRSEVVLFRQKETQAPIELPGVARSVPSVEQALPAGTPAPRPGCGQFHSGRPRAPPRAGHNFSAQPDFPYSVYTCRHHRAKLQRVRN